MNFLAQRIPGCLDTWLKIQQKTIEQGLSRVEINPNFAMPDFEQ